MGGVRPAPPDATGEPPASEGVAGRADVAGRRRSRAVGAPRTRGVPRDAVLRVCPSWQAGGGDRSLPVLHGGSLPRALARGQAGVRRDPPVHVRPSPSRGAAWRARPRFARALGALDGRWGAGVWWEVAGRFRRLSREGGVASATTDRGEDGMRARDPPRAFAASAATQAVALPGERAFRAERPRPASAGSRPPRERSTSARASTLTQGGASDVSPHRQVTDRASSA